MTDATVLAGSDSEVVVLVTIVDHELGAAVVVHDAEETGMVGVAMTTCGVRATGGSYLRLISKIVEHMLNYRHLQSLQSQSTTLPSRIQIPHLRRHNKRRLQARIYRGTSRDQAGLLRLVDTRRR